MIRRRRTTTAPVDLRGLELVASTENGDVLVPGLTLRASPDVVTVTGPSEQVLRSWSWAEISGLEADNWERGSQGHPLQVLELSAGGRSHRFLVGAPDLSVFLENTGGWSLNLTPATAAPAA